MSRESSPFGEVRIQISTPPEERSPFADSTAPVLSFSTPLAQTAIPIDDLAERPHVTFEKDEKEKKKPRKSVDESKSRRRDTTTTFTNFFHRIFDKEEKHKSTMSITEEERLLDRPNQLVLPAGDENWTEMKTYATDQFRTALDMGNETGMHIYEWKPDSLEEHLVTPAPIRNELIGMDFDRSENDDIERSLVTMLDEFRSGSLRSFSDEQIEAMRTAKQDHEEVTNMHIALYSLDSSDQDIESRLEAVCDQLSAKMINDAASQVADICRRNRDLLEQKAGELEVVFSHANPEYCSSLFIACLKAMWDVSVSKKQEQGLNRTVDLLKTFLETDLPLARECVLHCLQKKKLFLAYDIGKAAVEAYTFSGENALSSLTAVTLAAAIKTGQFDEAMNYVYTPIRFIVSELHPTQENIDVTSKRSRCAALPFFDSKYMLSYLFYCGLVTAKKEQYRLALQFMEMCIGVPGSVASQVQLDALKKYYVLSLIVNDDVNLPQNRSPSLLRILKAKGRLEAYTALTEAVKGEGNKTKAVQNVLVSKRHHFEQDHNAGLCQILLESIRKKLILNVAKSYSSIRLSTLAERSHCDQNEVVPFMKNLEAQGELSAEIDATNNTVRLSIKEKPTTKEQIIQKIKYVDTMHNELYRLDIVAQMNPSHIIRTLRGVAGQLAMLDDEESRLFYMLVQ